MSDSFGCGVWLFCSQSVCVRVSAFSSSHLLPCCSLSSCNHGNEIKMQIPEHACEGSVIEDVNCVSACRISHPHTDARSDVYERAHKRLCAHISERKHAHLLSSTSLSTLHTL